MKFLRIAIVVGILNLIYPDAITAQRMDSGLDVRVLAGLNAGATTPVPIPKDLKLTSYNPKLNPKLGANVRYYFNDKWGVGTGLTLDWKGMNIHVKVTDVHLRIDVPDVGTLTGYVTGKGTNQITTLYLTQPVYGIYRFNPKWQIKTGIYMAETLSRRFKGDVRNVRVVEEEPVEREKEVAYATLNYSTDVRKFDIGLLAGGEFNMNDRVGFYGDFTWGFTPYFSRTVPIHFTMRNIYLSLGVTYKIK